MSTADTFLEPDDIEDFIKETLADDFLCSVGDEGREIGICPYISFYIYNEPADFVSLCERVISVFGEFETTIIDEPFQLMTKGLDHDWLPPSDKRLPKDLMPLVMKAESEHQRFFLAATDMASPAESARWAFDAVVNDGIGSAFTRVKLTFRHRWYRKHSSKWHEFVERCIAQLQPDHCYSGFEVGNGGFNFMGAYECDVLERISADYFLGMDIDHTLPMGYHNFNQEDGYFDDVSLGGGIRTPTWCFMLSPYWQSRLGKTEAHIRAELNHPGIHISAMPYTPNKIYPQGGSALWIRLGELDLYPVDQGVPDLLIRANRLIRPVRCDQLQLLTLAPWDGDPNPRVDYEDSLRWMRRFDDDSDWPSPERRRGGKGGDGAGVEEALRAMPGERVPRTGIWWTPAVQGQAGCRRFEAGDTLPLADSTEYGAVVWYWRHEEQTPDSPAGDDAGIRT